MIKKSTVYLFLSIYCYYCLFYLKLSKNAPTSSTTFLEKKLYTSKNYFLICKANLVCRGHAIEKHDISRVRYRAPRPRIELGSVPRQGTVLTTKLPGLDCNCYSEFKRFLHGLVMILVAVYDRNFYIFIRNSK